jgi:hypothetical protein
MEENRPKRSWDSITKKWVFVVVVCCSPLFFLLASSGDERRGMAAWISASMIGFAVRYFWDLRKRFWFWMTIGFVAAIHVPLILLIRWPLKLEQYRGVQFLPIAFLDFAFVYGAVRLVESVTEKSH